MGQEAEETDPELKTLAAAYGECMWDWSLIEAELFLVFMAASGLVRCATFADTERRETLSRASFAVKGMEIRLAMTHALAQQRWEKSPYLVIWKNIHDELDKQRRVRGRIGHRTGLLFSNPDRGKSPIALLIDPRLYVDIAFNYETLRITESRWPIFYKSIKTFYFCKNGWPSLWATYSKNSTQHSLYNKLIHPFRFVRVKTTRLPKDLRSNLDHFWRYLNLV